MSAQPQVLCKCMPYPRPGTPPRGRANCSKCLGTGVVLAICTTCYGAGMVQPSKSALSDKTLQHPQICPTCGGKGKVGA